MLIPARLRSRIGNTRIVKGAPGRAALAVLAATAMVFGVVAWAALSPGTSVSAQVDVGRARSELAQFITDHRVHPAGSGLPDEGPRCPLVTPEELHRLAAATSTTLPADLGEWYGVARVDGDLRSDTGEGVVVVQCVRGPGAGGVNVFALDIGRFDAASGMTFDRVARRFGVGNVVRVEPPTIGGDLVGRCQPAGSDGALCIALWHLDGFVIGINVGAGPGQGEPRTTASLLAALVPVVVDTLIEGLPPTTTTTTTSTTTTTTLPPTTTTSTTTLPPTTTTTLPPTTTTTTTTLPPTTTTTIPPTTTTTTTLPPTTTTTTTTLPPTTTTTIPPTTTTTTTTTTTLPPTTTTLPPTTTTTTTTLPPTTVPPPTEPPPAPESVWDVILADAELSEFAAGVEAAGLVPLLSGLDPEHPLVTVLAPDDTAIEALVEWPQILADPQWVERFVLAHLLDDAVTAEVLFTPTDPPTEFETLNGDVLAIDHQEGTVNGAELVTPDLESPTGVVHVVDAVIVVPPQVPPEPTEPPPTTTTSTTTTTTLPPTTTTSTTTTTLPPTTTTTLPPTTTTSTTTLPPTTTTSTTTLPPTTTTTTTIPPTTTTTTTTLPPTTTTTTTTLPPTTTTTPTTEPPPTEPPPTDPPPPPESVWDVITADPELTEFVAGVEAAELVPLLTGLDPEHPLVTVLVPDDTAIEALVEWPQILADQQWLQRFVLAHVLDDAVTAEMLLTPTDPPTEFVTLNGDVLTIDHQEETVNGAELITPDLESPTGIVHVVDAVIVVPPQVPPEPTEPAPPTEPAAPTAPVDPPEPTEPEEG